MSFGIDIGSAHVTQLTELAYWPFPARDLFPLISEAEIDAVSGLLAEPFVDRRSGDLVLAIHTYVVEIGGKTIVVDTGNGNDKNRPNLLPHHMFDTDYLTRFAATGIDVDTVDLVISTHLHPDHCGWNTTLDSGVWKPTFTGATYVFGRIELEGLQQLAASGADDGVVSDLVKTFEDSVRPVLDAAAWVAVDDGHILVEHEETTVVVRVAPGHTGGHLTVEILTPDGGAVISGDVIHHPIQFLYPDLCQAGDADPAVSLRTRTGLLDRCAREGILLLPAHFPLDEPIAVGFNAIGVPEAASVLAVREPADGV